MQGDGLKPLRLVSPSLPGAGGGVPRSWGWLGDDWDVPFKGRVLQRCEEF